MFSLQRVGVFVPETTASIRELAEPLGLDPRQVPLFTRFFGLDRIPVATGIDMADMLIAAGEDALADDVDRDSVRYLVHGHTMQHVASSSRHLLEDVRRGLGLRRASVLSLSHMNCVVGLHALEVSRHLLQRARPQDTVLVLTGDRIVSHRIRVIPDTTVLGDAAAACLVGRDPRGDAVLGRALHVLGRFYQGMSCPPELRAEYKDIYAPSLAKVAAEAIADAGLRPEEIAAILPHNVNRLSWKRVCEDLGIPKDRVFLDNVPKLGHCYSSDPFINLASARAAGRVKPGDPVLMTTAGLGAAFAATVIRIGEGNRTEAAS